MIGIMVFLIGGLMVTVCIGIFRWAWDEPSILFPQPGEFIRLREGKTISEECPYLKAANEEVEEICHTH